MLTEGRVKFFSPQNSAGVSQEKEVAVMSQTTDPPLCATLEHKRANQSAAFASSDWGLTTTWLCSTEISPGSEVSYSVSSASWTNMAFRASKEKGRGLSKGQLQ